jgi:hypothetical protein
LSSQKVSAPQTISNTFKPVQEFQINNNSIKNITNVNDAVILLLRLYWLVMDPSLIQTTEIVSKTNNKSGLEIAQKKLLKYKNQILPESTDILYFSTLPYRATRGESNLIAKLHQENLYSLKLILHQMKGVPTNLKTKDDIIHFINKILNSL